MLLALVTRSCRFLYNISRSVSASEGHREIPLSFGIRARSFAHVMMRLRASHSLP